MPNGVPTDAARMQTALGAFLRRSSLVCKFSRTNAAPEYMLLYVLCLCAAQHGGAILGRDYLLHTLLPVARCTPSGCGHNLAVAQASTITPPAGAFPSMAFDVFGGRIVGQKLSDRHVNQAALRASYADLGTTLTRQHTSFSPNFTTLSIKHEVPGSSQSARGHRPLGLPSIRADAFRQEMRWVCGHFGVVICVDGWLQEARDISPQAAGTDVRNIVWRPSLLRDRLVRAFLFRQVFTKQLKCVVHVW